MSPGFEDVRDAVLAPRNFRTLVSASAFPSLSCLTVRSTDEAGVVNPIIEVRLAYICDECQGCLRTSVLMTSASFASDLILDVVYL